LLLLFVYHLKKKKYKLFKKGFSKIKIKTSSFFPYLFIS
jgi:hypothetical protein